MTEIVHPGQVNVKGGIISWNSTWNGLGVE